MMKKKSRTRRLLTSYPLFQFISGFFDDGPCSLMVKRSRKDNLNFTRFMGRHGTYYRRQAFEGFFHPAFTVGTHHARYMKGLFFLSCTHDSSIAITGLYYSCFGGFFVKGRRKYNMDLILRMVRHSTYYAGQGFKSLFHMSLTVTAGHPCHDKIFFQGSARHLFRRFFFWEAAF